MRILLKERALTHSGCDEGHDEGRISPIAIRAETS